MTIYTAPSGANVFATGSSWVRASTPTRRALVSFRRQQITANFLSRTLQSPARTIERLDATVATAPPRRISRELRGDRNASTSGWPRYDVDQGTTMLGSS